MSEVGSASTASANVETLAFARDLELGALQASSVGTSAETLQRAEPVTAASDPTTAFALMYARFSSGSLVHGRTIVAPGDLLAESTRDDDAPEALAAGGRDSSGTSPSPQTQGHAAPGAPGIASDFAAYALMPQTPSIDSRSERPKRERGRHPQPEQREEIEPQKQGYTIDDIVQFAGVTVAERRTQPVDLTDRTSSRIHT